MKNGRPITPYENLRRAIAGNPLWTPSLSEFPSFSPRIIPDGVARGFVMENSRFDPDTEAGGPDMFGVEWEWVPQVGGSMVRAEKEQLLTDISDWEATLEFPDLDAWDWEGSAELNAGYIRDNQARKLWFQTGLFERLISFLGFENAAVALVYDEQKPYVHALLDRVCALYEEIFERSVKHYGIEHIYFHDDWGGQNSPFFSEGTVREMLLPYVRRLASFAHERGLVFQLHSCGKIENFVPLMIEAGVDAWSGQAINDMHAVLEECAGRILVDVNPGFEFGGIYTEDEAIGLTSKFLDEYSGFLDSVIFQDFIPLETPGEMVYRSTLKGC